MLSLLSRSQRSDLTLDLGTATTRIGRCGEGVVLSQPTLVAVDPSTGRILSGGRAVGHVAAEMLARRGDSIGAIRPLQSGAIGDYEACEAALRQFFAMVPAGGVRRPRHVLVTIASQITAVERRAVLNTVQRAGAQRVLLLASIRAAALGAQVPMADPEAKLICQIGAGWTEVAVFGGGEVITVQATRVGGDAMDQALADRVRRDHGLRMSPEEAERLRIETGLGPEVADEPAHRVRGIDPASGLPQEIEVASSRVRSALDRPLEQISATVRSALDDLAPSTAAELMGRGAHLCGGGALLPGIDCWLSEQTGMSFQLTDRPAETTIDGASLCLENLDRWHSLLEPDDAR